LMPFVEDEARIQATGPSISLRVQAAQSLGIILHELATNASKFCTGRKNHDPLGLRPDVGTT
jgi:two-component sensor histidine kinase